LVLAWCRRRECAWAARPVWAWFLLKRMYAQFIKRREGSSEEIATLVGALPGALPQPSRAGCPRDSRRDAGATRCCAVPETETGKIETRNWKLETLKPETDTRLDRQQARPLGLRCRQGIQGGNGERCGQSVFRRHGAGLQGFHQHLQR